MKLDRLDAILLGVITVFVAAYTWATFSFATVPFEDAAILMRFADHMAQGHGIVWNIGDKPIDGATDFLFLVTLGWLGMAGLDIPDGVHAVGIGSHLLTCLLVYFAIRKLHGAPRWMAVLSAIYLAIGPALRQVEGGFGAPYFALFAATCWYLAYQVFLDIDNPRTGIWYAASALMLGLIRPEGVFLSAFMVGAVLFMRGWKRSRRFVLQYVVIFGVLGASYFLWRWSYFGHPLPNPFYVKGGGSLYPFSLVDSCKNVVKLALPFLPILGLAAAVASARLLNSVQRGKYLALFVGVAAVVWAFGLWTLLEGDDKSDAARPTGVKWCAALGAAWLLGPLLLSKLFPRWTGVPSADRQQARAFEEPIFVLLPVFAFTFLWILLSAIMNYLERFQYAVLPLIVISWPALLQGLVRTRVLPSLQRSALARVLLLGLFAGASLGFMVQRYQTVQVQHDGTYAVAKILSEYGGPERRMIVTNAGHLPYYSGWSAMDAWGLTDQQISHHGLTWDYVAAFKPDVIQFDGFFSPQISPLRPEFEGWSWYEATLLLKRYAEENGYVLAAAYGLDENKSHHYYVRSDWTSCDEVVARIRALDYRWFADPKSKEPAPKAWDFRKPRPQ